jgi:hypothetical protein
MLTNKVALSPLSMTAMLPHGSLICPPDQTVVSLPSESNTSRQPGPFVLVVPSVLGVDPTMSQPLDSIAMAVESPTPPGHCERFCGSLANGLVARVSGLTTTIVPPVP